MSTDLPPSVPIELEDTVRSYVRARLRQHTQDGYAGVPMSKFPEDLRIYEHLLWLSHADVVIELGIQFGGSSLWFRDRLHALARYRSATPGPVIAVDIDIAPAQGHLSSVDPAFSDDIVLIEASVTDADLPDRVAAYIPPGARCLVIEDTAHEYDTTLAALRGFSRFVPPGGFFVVEDGVVDDDRLRIHPTWPRGVIPALAAWLATEGEGFSVRRDLELYGVTCHPGGFLQRERVEDA